MFPPLEFQIRHEKVHVQHDSWFQADLENINLKYFNIFITWTKLDTNLEHSSLNFVSTDIELILLRIEKFKFIIYAIIYAYCFRKEQYMNN